MAMPQLIQHFPRDIVSVWEGNQWTVFVQSFFSYDWRQFLMVFMSAVLLGVAFERKVGSYSFLALAIFSMFAIPQLLNLVLEPVAVGANAFLGMLLILKMTGKFPQVSGESFRSSLYLFFILLLYLLYYGQNNQGVEAQIGHMQFILGVLLAFFWRFGRLVYKKSSKSPHKAIRRSLWLPHILNVATVLIISSAFFASWDIRWQIRQMEKDILGGKMSLAQQKFQEIYNPKDKLTTWFLIYLQLKNDVRIQSLDEMIETLKEDTQNHSQTLLAEIYMGEFDSAYQKHDVAWRILKTLPQTSAEILNLTAMLHCGSQLEVHHDPQKGLSLMEQVNQLSQWSDPAYLDTYAACHARAQNWDQAQKWILRAENLQGRKDSTKILNQNRLKEILSNRDLIENKKMVTYGAAH